MNINSQKIIGSHEGQVAWRGPSNIALVKYWGKHGRQLPSNPSISLTLSQAYSQTQVAYQYQDSRSAPSVVFTFEGKPQAAFEEKIKKYLSSIQDVFPIVSHLNLKIDSHNTFPHSSGIASSASSMSALAMCLAEIKQSLLGQAQMNLGQASELSRLGSGSASRSILFWISLSLSLARCVCISVCVCRRNEAQRRHQRAAAGRSFDSQITIPQIYRESRSNLCVHQW